MSKVFSVGTAALLGASLMYLLDPANGRRRRARLRDRGRHAVRAEQLLAGKARRDLAHRARGLVARMRQPLAAAATDVVLEERVRAELGRCASHPRAIVVEAHDGSVLLHGVVLAGERDRILHEVSRVRGVCAIVDRLSPRLVPGREPELQGRGYVPGPRRLWTPAGRGAAIAGGALLALWGLVKRSRLVTFGGGALAMRGLVETPLHPGIAVRKSILVFAPVADVFALWSHFDRFPRFMEHVRGVVVRDDDPRLSHWIVDGPAGVPIGFDAELTDLVVDRRVAWRTLPGQRLEHTGVVRFEPEGIATRVNVEMTYRPPGGRAGHAIARLLGWDPRHRLDDDLVRMKALLEQGRTRAHGHRVSVGEVL
jgi:uncharacterized membrane protein